jgi:hypothetical protein
VKNWALQVVVLHRKGRTLRVILEMKEGESQEGRDWRSDPWEEGGCLSRWEGTLEDQ